MKAPMTKRWISRPTWARIRSRHKLLRAQRPRLAQLGLLVFTSDAQSTPAGDICIYREIWRRLRVYEQAPGFRPGAARTRRRTCGFAGTHCLTDTTSPSEI